MKKTPATSKKARSLVSYHKHLRPDGKRRANKATRKIGKETTASEQPPSPEELMQAAVARVRKAGVKATEAEIMGFIMNHPDTILHSSLKDIRATANAL